MRGWRSSSVSIADLLAKIDKRINEKFCKMCKVGHYKPHPELMNWGKCLTCGHCKQMETDLGTTRVVPNNHK